MTIIRNTADETKSGLHSRNRNNGRYDFPELIAAYPELKQFVFTNKHRHESIDFSDPDAVRTLNTVLLKHHYGLSYWEIPKNYLCPPIPGRADYIHHAADLLASIHGGIIPRGNAISILDIGVGSSCIYPILGNKEYGWKFVGADIDPVSLQSARNIIESNDFHPCSIEIRQQEHNERIFHGIIQPSDRFDMTICNPPFHSSVDQAHAGTRRKWKNLGVPKERDGIFNFGGQQNELLFRGGEEQFVKNMITESAQFAKSVLWFTTLISKQSLLPFVGRTMKQFEPTEVKVISMAQGQKKSRFVAWTFQSPREQQDWIRQYWV